MRPVLILMAAVMMAGCGDLYVLNEESHRGPETEGDGNIIADNSSDGNVINQGDSNFDPAYTPTTINVEDPTP